VTVVVATCLLDDGTEVYVLDPPPDRPEDEHPEMKSSDKVSERTGKNSWRIRDPKAFRERTIIAEESNLLKWAGQYHTASLRDERLGRNRPELIAMPDAPLETKRTDVGIFRGTEEPLFPKLGLRSLRMFTGVDEDVLNELLIQPREPEEPGARLRHMP